MNESKARLLVVDDDEDFLELLALTLQAQGYQVVRANDGDEALRLVASEEPALLVCDINMPRLDGFSVCRKLREAQHRIPIVLLTTRDSDVDEALGLDLGADDYLSKPFRQRVLIARIEALLRREQMRGAGTAPMSVDTLVVGEVLHIDPVRLEVHYREEPVELTVTEFRLLVGLVERPGHVLGRLRLLELMRDDYDSFVDDRMVDSYVRRLRRKLGAVHPDFGGIETVIGAGYRWRSDAV